METLLLTAGFIGIIFLILTPWVKTGTIVSVGSLVGYFYFAGVDSWVPIALFILGLVLIVLEVFIPDFGLIGMLGVSSVALGIYFTVGDFSLMVRDLSVALIASVILLFILIRNGYSLSNFNKIVLNASSKETDDRDESEEQDQVHVGMIGIASTPLRPSGKALFDGHTISYDVLSSEGHISVDTEIVIQEINGTKIVVRRQK